MRGESNRLDARPLERRGDGGKSPPRLSGDGEEAWREAIPAGTGDFPKGKLPARLRDAARERDGGFALSSGECVDLDNLSIIIGSKNQFLTYRASVKWRPIFMEAARLVAVSSSRSWA
jgi:hypothetical protein